MQWSDIIPQEASELAVTLAEHTQKQRNKGYTLYPPQDQLFRALQLTPPNKTKVVIVGQDPYHTPGMANGLAFSVNKGVTMPPSLRNINKELSADCGGALADGDLTPWAEQGVLLLNSVLTVYEHEPGSCSKWEWQFFTKAVLRAAAELPQPIVFLLWGTYAQTLKTDIMVDLCVLKPNGVIEMPSRKKAILMSSHPSPLSAQKPCKDTPAFMGSKPFSKVNSLLLEWGSEPIRWTTQVNQ